MQEKIQGILKRSIIQIKAVPYASKTEIVEVLPGDILKIKIAAPPVKGRANKVLIDYLTGLLPKPKKNVIIIKGQYNTNKTVKIL